MAIYTKDGAILEMAKLRWALRWALENLVDDMGPDVWDVLPSFGLDVERIQSAPSPTPPGGLCECGVRLPENPQTRHPPGGVFGAVSYICICSCGRGWLWAAQAGGDWRRLGATKDGG